MCIHVVHFIWTIIVNHFKISNLHRGVPLAGWISGGDVFCWHCHVQPQQVGMGFTQVEPCHLLLILDFMPAIETEHSCSFLGLSSYISYFIIFCMGMVAKIFFCFPSLSLVLSHWHDPLTNAPRPTPQVLPALPGLPGLVPPPVLAGSPSWAERVLAHGVCKICWHWTNEYTIENVVPWFCLDVTDDLYSLYILVAVNIEISKFAIGFLGSDCCGVANG